MQDSLRIVFVTNNYTPYSGGVVSSINAFAQELRASSHIVSIITLDFLGSAHNDPPYVFRIPCPIKFLYKNNHMALPLRTYTHMRELIMQLKPDIIHSHHPFLLGKVAAEIAQEYVIPLVFTYHSLYEEWAYVVPLPPIITKPIIKNVVMHYCKNVDGIIAPSSNIKNYLTQQGIDTPLTVIPSCLQPHFFPSQSFNLKKRCTKKYFHLLSVTRCSKEKNIFFLVELIALLHHVDEHCKMTIVGYGPLWQEIIAYAYDTLRLCTDQITFIHRPVKDKLVQFYKNADLFIFSSQNDTQGLVLAESMAAGTPVLALDGPGQRDIIQNGKNGFIVNDMDEMLKTIATIMKYKNLHKQMQYNAWLTAHRYKAQVLTASLMNFYTQIRAAY